MPDLRESLPVKAAALFLAGILAVLCALSALGITCCYEMNYYEKDGLTYTQSEGFLQTSYVQAYNALYSCYLYGGDPAQFTRDGTYFTVAYAQDPENILYATELPDSFVHTDSFYLHADEVFQDSGTDPELAGRFGLDYLVTVYYTTLPGSEGLLTQQALFDLLYPLRYTLLVLAPLCLLLTLAVLVFLCCAAGHRKGCPGLTPNWQDRIPLDLYLAGDAVILLAAFRLVWQFGYYLYLPLIAAACVVSAILALALLMTLATRLKLGGWWRNTVVYRVLRGIIRLVSRMARAVRDAARLLPYTWRTVLFVGGMLLLQFLLGLLMWNDYQLNSLWFLLWLVLDLVLLLAAVFYAWQMKLLFREGRSLASGDLESKVDTSRMFFSLKRHGDDLNAIGEGMTAAVEQRMRSEHFKTELITNVSHDLKTPLTSIINYVDLLKKERIDSETARQYLDVLDRKSQRLKKLTEDLVEASKASTGVLTVHLERLDLNQLLEQALGEYQDRFLALDLHPMLLLPTPPVHVTADGRHLWRVIDNLLSNCCKYTLPGTRVYAEVAPAGDRAMLTVKNISRDPLNISAEELMERFVRGDASRTTEGSGLGLSIARSLTELQGGQFHLSVDGDLFKAMVTLPMVP